MTLLSPGLVAVLAVAAVLGRVLAPLAREIRLALVTWLALRGTRPPERPEILNALMGVPDQAGPIPPSPEIAICAPGIESESDAAVTHSDSLSGKADQR
jgi:hypothetical protein